MSNLQSLTLLGKHVPSPSADISFNKLPSEVRNMIYHYALVAPGNLTIARAAGVYTKPGKEINYTADTTTVNGRVYFRAARGKLSPNILATCKQIRSEATAMLYHQPLFFYGPEPLSVFLQAIGYENLSYLQEVTIDTGYNCDVQRYTPNIPSLLAKATALHTMTWTHLSRYDETDSSAITVEYIIETLFNPLFEKMVAAGVTERMTRGIVCQRDVPRFHRYFTQVWTAK